MQKQWLIANKAILKRTALILNETVIFTMKQQQQQRY